MEGRIRRMHCSYRLASGGARALVGRLEKLCSTALASPCGQALAAGTGGASEEVWLVRRVAVSLVVQAAELREEERLAQRWGGRVAMAALAAVARGADGEHVMHFADEAAFRASFVADLLLGEAWQRWYFGSFSRLRALPLGEAVGEVLGEAGEHLPEMLAHLAHSGALESALSLLEPARAAQIWSAALPVVSLAGTEAELLRPVFMTAVEMAVARGHLAAMQPEAAERWLRAYADAGAAALDWKDAAQLSAGVVAALEFLRAHGPWLASGAGEQERKSWDAAERERLLDAWQAAQALEERGAATLARVALRAALLVAERQDLLPALAGEREIERLFTLYSAVPISPPTDDAQRVAAVRDTLRWLQGFERGHVAREQHSSETTPVLGRAQWAWLERRTIEAFFRALSGHAEQAELASPRTRLLLGDFGSILAAELPRLLARRETTAATALRLYGRLAALRASEWSGDTFAIRAVDGLLYTAEWLAGATPEWLAEAERSLAGPDRKDRQSEAEDPNVHSPEEATGRATLVRELLSRRLSSAQVSERAQAILASPGTLPAAAFEHALACVPAAEVVTRQFLRTFGAHGLELAAVLAARSAEQVCTLPASAALHVQDLSELFTGLPVRCAGVFLLVRAVLDTRLAAVARRAGYPLSPCLAMLAACWGGEQALFYDRVDAGISLFSGQGAELTLDDLRTLWRAVPPKAHSLFQAELLRVLAARGVLHAGALEVHTMDLAGGGLALLLGSEHIWPLVRIIADESERPEALKWLQDTWAEATGALPALLPHESPAPHLTALLAALNSNHLRDPLADLTHALAANSLLRCWALWLYRFTGSSAPYLLEHFIRRSGVVTQGEGGYSVALSPKPLDVVLQMAGYLQACGAVSEPWQCEFRFNLGTL